MWPLRLSFLFVLASAGTCLETKLISPTELGKRVLMTEITDFTRVPLFVRTPDFLLSLDDVGSMFQLRGRDKRGRRWQVILRDAVREAWSCKVRGSRTYYFAGYTGGAGLAPETWILVISFDEAGRPVPFFVITHGSYDSNGIEDVLDLDGNGPELLEQSYWRSMQDDPGYYVTSLYQKRGPYWYRSDGRHGEHIFPAFEKWSVLWKDRPAELVADPRTESVRDSGNDPAGGTHTKIIGVAGTRVRVGRETACESVGVNGVVIDSANGRRIDFQLAPGSLSALAREGKDVVLTGLYRWAGHAECDSSIMWISAGH